MFTNIMICQLDEALLQLLDLYRISVYKPWTPTFDIRHPPPAELPPEPAELEQLPLDIENVRQYRSDCLEALAQHIGIPYGFDTFV